MVNVALYAGFAMIAGALLITAWRLVRGPEIVDRILALDTLYINTIGLLVLVGVQREDDLFFEAALLIAMMGFVGTLTLCKHLTRGNVID